MISNRCPRKDCGGTLLVEFLDFGEVGYKQFSKELHCLSCGRIFDFEMKEKQIKMPSVNAA